MSDKQALSDQLSGCAVVQQLTEDEAAELLAMVKAVRRSRLKAMFSSIEEALGHLPRVLRGPARKILLG
ncbi:MAG TPA: hypothetical protein VFK41_04575 [Nocardioidaceae bacterium]|nr:hypothetical protein [Nocardioidaceae bacterium]